MKPQSHFNKTVDCFVRARNTTDEPKTFRRFKNPFYKTRKRDKASLTLVPLYGMVYQNQLKDESFKHSQTQYKMALSE